MGKLIAAGAAGAVLIVILAALVYFEPLPRVGGAKPRTLEVFSDCDGCPQMLPIPPGTFEMGEPPRRREQLRTVLGGPRPDRRVVTITRSFAIGRTEVTFAQWEACVADGGCNGYLPPDEGWGRGDHPVIHVTWNDAQAYVRWLSEKTGATYRLPTEAEWEYAARSGSKARYSWGRYPSHRRANFGEPDCPPCAPAAQGRDRWINTAPAAQFPPNAFGLHDMAGNVYEWTEDCSGALPPGEADGSAVVTDECGLRTMRGGAWYSSGVQIQVFYRSQNPANWEDWDIGFRVARDM